jgi:hypothetical protein
MDNGGSLIAIDVLVDNPLVGDVFRVGKADRIGRVGRESSFVEDDGAVVD